MLLDVHVPTKESLTYKCRIERLRPVQDSKTSMLVQDSILGNWEEEEVSRWDGFKKMGRASWHIQTHTLPYSIYIYVGVTLFTLEYGERVAYMETHPQCYCVVAKGLPSPFSKGTKPTNLGRSSMYQL